MKNREAIPVVLICGSRKSGKTTFSKQLVEKLFTTNKYSQIMLLDLDCGQTPLLPGHLSLIEFSLSKKSISEETKILQKTIKQFSYGSVNPTRKISLYETCLRKGLVLYVKKYYNDDIPLVIDTMGWITGLGLIICEIMLKFRYLSDVIYMKQSEDDVEFQKFCDKTLIDSKKKWSFHSIEAYNMTKNLNFSLAEARRIRILDYSLKTFKEDLESNFEYSIKDCFEDIYMCTFSELIDRIVVIKDEISMIRGFDFDSHKILLLIKKSFSTKEKDFSSCKFKRNQLILEHLLMDRVYAPIMDFEMPFYTFKLKNSLFRKTRLHVPRIYK